MLSSRVQFKSRKEYQVSCAFFQGNIIIFITGQKALLFIFAPCKEYETSLSRARMGWFIRCLFEGNISLPL